MLIGKFKMTSIKQTKILKYKSLFLPKIYEAVIRTNKYEKILNGILNKVFNDIPISNNVVEYLNDKFKPYYITFEIKTVSNTDIIKFGIIKGKTINNKVQEIFIYCTNYINEIFKNKFLYSQFQEICLQVLRHELVHRGQFINEAKQLMPDRSILDKEEIKYYSSKYEIMAFANMIVEEYRLNGIQDNMILKKINTRDVDDNEFISFYQKHFKTQPLIINRLYKYIYEYIKGEAKNIL